LNREPLESPNILVLRLPVWTRAHHELLGDRVHEGSWLFQPLSPGTRLNRRGGYRPHATPKDGVWLGFLVAPVVLNPAGGAVHAFTRRGGYGPVGRGLVDAGPFCHLDGSAPLRALPRLVESRRASHNEGDSSH
jgi:hypothetical protein